MTPTDFATLCRAFKNEMLSDYLSEGSESAVGTLIGELSLKPDQLDILREMLDIALTDTIYGMLLGLDGFANIGGKQVNYCLTDEDGDVLAGDCGKLEAAAWAIFHGDA